MITKWDKILIKNLWESKQYGTRRLLNKFPNKNQSRCCLEDFLHRLRATGSIERAPGSGRSCAVLTTETVDAVEELVQSQEDRPQSHLSSRQISTELGISRRTLSCIIHDDLSLKCHKKRRAHKLAAANQAARSQHAGQLLQRFSDSDVDFIWFSNLCERIVLVQLIIENLVTWFFETV